MRAVVIAGSLACGAAVACGSFDAEPATTDPGVDANAVPDARGDVEVDAMADDAMASDAADDGVDRTGMVNAGGFFIDKHEVSFSEYNDFVMVLRTATPPSLPARCAGKPSYTPTYDCTSSGVRGALGPSRRRQSATSGALPAEAAPVRRTRTETRPTQRRA